MPAIPCLVRPFNDGRLALQLSDQAADFPFADFAHALVRARNGRIVERLGAFGVDETYWDLAIDGQVLTLHRQHYLGVFLCATDAASEVVLETVVPFAEDYLRELQVSPVIRWVKSLWRSIGAAAR